MATNINYQTSALTLDTLAAKVVVPRGDTTVTDRFAIQTDSTNNYTAIGIMPNGTSGRAGLQLFNGASRANISALSFLNELGTIAIDANQNGTGTIPPLHLGNESYHYVINVSTNNKVGINVQDTTGASGNGNHTGSLNVCTGANLGATVGDGQQALRMITGADNGTSYSVNQDSRGRLQIATQRIANSSGGDEWWKQTWFISHVVDSSTVNQIGFQIDTTGLTRFYSDRSMSAFVFYNTATNYAAQGCYHQCPTANSTGWTSWAVYSSNATDVEFYVRGDGNVFADGVFTGGGADYAEMFEWEDQNPTDEDRRGISVVLTQTGFIRPATEQDSVDDIIGVISATQSMRGNEPLKWKDKYVRDDYGAHIRDQDGHKILNPEFDSEQEYVKRSERKEWDPVGLVGKIYVRKGQPVNPYWILFSQGEGTKPDCYLVR